MLSHRRNNRSKEGKILFLASSLPQWAKVFAHWFFFLTRFAFWMVGNGGRSFRRTYYLSKRKSVRKWKFCQQRGFRVNNPLRCAVLYLKQGFTFSDQQAFMNGIADPKTDDTLIYRIFLTGIFMLSHRSNEHSTDGRSLTFACSLWGLGYVLCSRNFLFLPRFAFWMVGMEAEVWEACTIPQNINRWRKGGSGSKNRQAKSVKLHVKVRFFFSASQEKNTKRRKTATSLCSPIKVHNHKLVPCLWGDIYCLQWDVHLD